MDGLGISVIAKLRAHLHFFNWIIVNKTKISYLAKAFTFNCLPSQFVHKDSLIWAAVKAQWFRLCLPSCGTMFKSQAHYLCFFNLYYWNCNREKDVNKQKEARIGPFFKFDFAFQNDNRLTFIAEETFASLKNLRVLRLDNNRITLFPVWNVLRSLPLLKQITLAANPWSCQCDFVQKLQVRRNVKNLNAVKVWAKRAGALV